MEEKTEHTCKYCNKTFSRNSNLKRHISNIHFPRSKTENRDKFICHLCSKIYSYKKTLDRHIKVCQSDNVKLQTPKYINCCLCSVTGTSKTDMLQHYSVNHDIDVSTTKLKFATLSEFENWKDQIERNTISRYVKVTIKRKKNKLLYVFRCHRDGFYKSAGKNIRHLKRLGSNKINGHCPSKMYTTISSETGEVFVDFLPTHVGHSMDLGRIPLKKSDRDYIASQISQKIPFDDILNNIRDNIDENNFDRLHLLTKHDLFNIEQAYNLGNESVRRTNTSKNLESWISQTADCNSVVRYYKKHGELHEECNYELQLNDYLLIIMNDGQLDFLKKYGNECIYIESKGYDFELTTIMVLDDLREGFPCMFAFSNRSDIEIFKIMFNILKNILNEEIISPKVFISNLSDAFYIAWCEEMGPVETRLYCSWDINRDWKKNVLAKVKEPENQKILFKTLRNLLEEPDVDVFETLLENSLNDFEKDPDFNNFGLYFQLQYVENREAWANCYRQHFGLNTNLNVEGMHCNLKNLYLKAGTADSLDKAINFIMKMARDKLHERLVVLHKGKITTKLKDLRRKHKLASMWTATEDISILTNEDGTWTISLCEGTESYDIETLNMDCNCDLRCIECNACIHTYTCTCVDSSIKWNMCKHIHFLCIHLESILSDNDQVVSDEDIKCNENVVIEENYKNNTENARINQLSQTVYTVSDINQCQENPDIDDDHRNVYAVSDINQRKANNVVIDENHRKMTETAILNQLSQTVYTVSDIDQRKANIHEEFMSYLNAASTIEHCKVLENALISVGPAFAAIHSVSTKMENFESETDNAEETIQLERINLPCPDLVYFKKQ